MNRTNILLNKSYPHLDSFMRQLPKSFEDGGVTLYRGRNRVKRFDVAGQVVVVKRYKQPHWMQRIDYTFFRPSKGRRAYYYARRLKELGVDTPEAIGCVEVYSCGLFKQCYFVSAEDVRPSCKDLYDEDLPYRDSLISALAGYLAELHGKGFLHGDTNLSNFLYNRDPSGAFHFAVIDINRSQFVDQPSRALCLENLYRLTHVRNILYPIVRAYAACRGWDGEACVAVVEHRLGVFERRKLWLHRIFPRRKCRK